MKKVFFKLATGTFLYGNYAKKLMINNHIDSKKLHVIYNSLSYGNHCTIRKDLRSSDIFFKHFNNHNKNLIFIGRLTAIKKLNILIDALKMMANDGVYLNLTLIGAGETEHMLKNKVKDCNLENNIWFYGACYDDKLIAELIYNADLCVSPGNVGLTAIHSMTFGTPVITHNLFSYQMPEYEAIEEGITGAFFDYDDPFSLLNTIIKWFQIMPDREAVRKACYRTIDYKYNPNRQIDLIQKVLRINDIA